MLKKVNGQQRNSGYKQKFQNAEMKNQQMFFTTFSPHSNLTYIPFTYFKQLV